MEAAGARGGSAASEVTQAAPAARPRGRAAAAPWPAGPPARLGPGRSEVASLHSQRGSRRSFANNFIKHHPQYKIPALQVL